MMEKLKLLRHRIGCWSRWPRFPRQRLAKNSWSKDYPCQLRYAYSGIPEACLGTTRISLDWLVSARDRNETFRCNEYRNQNHNRNNSERSHAFTGRNDGGMWRARNDLWIVAFCLGAVFSILDEGQDRDMRILVVCWHLRCPRPPTRCKLLV